MNDVHIMLVHCVYSFVKIIAKYLRVEDQTINWWKHVAWYAVEIQSSYRYKMMYPSCISSHLCLYVTMSLRSKNCDATLNNTCVVYRVVLKVHTMCNPGACIYKPRSTIAFTILKYKLIGTWNNQTSDFKAWEVSHHPIWFSLPSYSVNIYNVWIFFYAY